MLFSGFSAAFVVAAAALLNSDNAVLSEAREVSRSLWNDWRAAQDAVGGTAWKGVLPCPQCPYCTGGPCPVCQAAYRAYDEACGDEGTIVAPPCLSRELLTSALNRALTTVSETVDRIKVVALDAFLTQRAAGSIADATPAAPMGSQFLPGCDFGWTAAPDPLVPNPERGNEVREDRVARRAPEPPDDAESPPPAPVEPAVANQVEADPFDHLYLPPPPKRATSIRPMLYGAAHLLQRFADAATAASERLYAIAGDEQPDDAD